MTKSIKTICVKEVESGNMDLYYFFLNWGQKLFQFLKGCHRRAKSFWQKPKTEYLGSRLTHWFDNQHCEMSRKGEWCSPGGLCPRLSGYPKIRKIPQNQCS